MPDLKEAHERALQMSEQAALVSEVAHIEAYVFAMDTLGFRLLPKEATEEMKRAGRKSLRESGLMPAYTDQGPTGQTPVMQHLLGPAWSAMAAAFEEKG